MTASSNSSTTARSRPISICRAGCAATSNSRPTRNWAAFGIQGLAPYFFDLEVTGFVSGEGHLAAKLEASYDLLLTQRLILQPQVELNVYSKADPARLVGAGFSDIDTGLRLRYEFSRKFAPYIGVVYRGEIRADGEFCAAGGREHGRCALRLRCPGVVLRAAAMRTVIASLLIAALLAVLGAVAVIYAGVYDLAPRRRIGA